MSEYGDDYANLAPSANGVFIRDSCERGYGIFHNLHLAVGVLSANAPITTMDPTTGMQTSAESAVTAGEIVFEGGFLGLPSSFAPTNFHGLEFSTGIRTEKLDFWMSFGTAVTFLNLGHGGPGTLRVGGSFGVRLPLAPPLTGSSRRA